MAPNITAIPEIMNTQEVDPSDNLTKILKHPVRGIPLITGKTKSEWINHGAEDLERFRPLTNVEDAVDKLLWVYDHPKEVNKITNRAYKWVTKLDWDTVTAQWEQLINRTYKTLQQERQNPDNVFRKWQSYRLPQSALPETKR
jgi:hypothetical protein